MMNKPQSTVRQAARYLLLLPLAGLLVLASCERQTEQPKAPAGARELRFVLDGQSVSQATIDQLNPADIERMEVITEAQALREFGAPAGSAVSVVVTKRNAKSAAVAAFDRRYGLGSYVNAGEKTEAMHFTEGVLPQAAYFLDGRPATKEAVGQIDPQQLEYMIVCTGKEAQTRFHFAESTAAHGVIVVVTKTNAQSAPVLDFNRQHGIEQSKAAPKAVGSPTSGQLYPNFLATDRC